VSLCSISVTSGCCAELRTRQFARFLVVGVGNTFASFVVYRLLLAMGMPYALAAPFAFAAGALNGYVLNRRWTFDARDSRRARLTYVGIQAFGAVSTTLLVAFFVQSIGVGRVGAFALTIPPVTVCTFAAIRVWAFADRN
jgi:putative flippase GtrA